MGPDRDSTIAQQASSCLTLFERLLEIQKEQELSKNGIPGDAIIDAQARFRTWVENIGALQRGEASLDHRLRHADVRLAVLKLLKQLYINLDDLWQIFSGARAQQTWTSLDDVASLDFSEFADSDDDDDGEELATPSLSSSSSRPTTESQLLHQSALEAITSLLKLSMSIRRSTRGNKFGRSSTAQKYETQYDILHVRDRYPFASENTALIERLGKANAQRRQWLSYRKRHREKLAINAYSEDENPLITRTQISESEVAMSVQRLREEDDQGLSILTGENKVSTILSSTKASTFDQRKDFDRDMTETEQSESTYSESRFSDFGQETNLAPQPPPESVDGNPFECPYCFSIIIVTGSRSWTKHVHSDLASYVCTQDHCSHPLFESRNQWFNHELDQHRRQWVCSICGSTSCSMDSLEKHMRLQHPGTFLESQLPALIARSGRPLERILASACPLCDYEAILKSRLDIYSNQDPVTVKASAFRNHLGRHLEQLALFVLPKQEVKEQAEGTVRSDVANEEVMLSGQAADSVDSEETESKPEAEHGPGDTGPNLPDGTATMQMILGTEVAGMTPETAATLLDQVKTATGLGIDESPDEPVSAPDLAFVWMPPMDFTPPEADFEVDDDDLLPRREEPMFGGDIFTPGWVRGYGKEKEGFCGRCNPGVWYNLEDSSYENNLTYMHGIAPSGLSLPRPSSLRQIEGNHVAWQGYCDACGGWRNLKKSSAGWNWFRHWVKEHDSLGRKPTTKYLHPKSANSHNGEGRLLVKLTEYVRNGNFPGFKSLLNQHPRLAFRPNALGRTPLHFAAELGNVAFMQYLLDRVATPYKVDVRSFIDATSYSGETCLMLAASQGNKKAAEWLISKEADINVIAANGYTALDYAAEAGFSQLAELLVAHKADTEKAKIYHQVRVRNIQGAQARITSTKDNASLQRPKEDSIGMEGLTPLHKAALQGDIDSLKAALEEGEGTDIEAFAQHGATPLMLAASKGHHNAVKLLLASGANIDATSTKGWTTLMNAVRNQDARTVEQLISNGADVNHLSPDRWTALAEASYQGQKEIMEILLRCGADTESRSSHDWTPLMHASYKGDEAAVRLLLDAGSNTEVASGHDETAILLAAAGGYTDIVRMLLMYGCAPEPPWAKNQDNSPKEVSQKAKPKPKEIGEPEDRVHARGWTPLMLASQGGHVEIGQILLERNVNTEAKSPHEKTALEIAKENGRIDMASILEFARHKTSTTP